eukprot:gene5324-4286_t
MYKCSLAEQEWRFRFDELQRKEGVLHRGQRAVAQRERAVAQRERRQEEDRRGLDRRQRAVAQRERAIELERRIATLAGVEEGLKEGLRLQLIGIRKEIRAAVEAGVAAERRKRQQGGKPARLGRR